MIYNPYSLYWIQQQKRRIYKGKAKRTKTKRKTTTTKNLKITKTLL